MYAARRLAAKSAVSSFSPAQQRLFRSTPSLNADFTHAIIGGGVVGLAIARQLSLRPNTTTVLIERHASLGTETSSRNSEVIHAGIYYGAGSLKSELCIRGKQLMYSLCEKHNVGHRRTGKWIVAQNGVQREALEKMHKFCTDEIDVPVRWVSRKEFEQDNQGVRADAGVLESPTTGIVDSHGLMTCLEGLFEEAGGVVALNSPVTSVSPAGTVSSSSSSSSPGNQGWEVQVRDPEAGESSSITAEVLINAAGLGAVDIHNMIVPEERKKQIFFAKGNYFGYSKSHPKPSRLIYPAPEPGAGGLGTHLTMDLGGQIRFGPDVEWVSDANDLGANSARLAQAIEEIKKYLPEIDETCIEATYAGIRPKLASSGAVGSGKGFQDFVIRKEDGYEGWVNLLGIESPGLTSSLAIGQKVEDILYGSVTES